MNRLTFGARCCALVLAASMTGAAAPSADPLEGELIALEKESWVAWQGHDGAFFERFLSDDHVEMQPGGRATKADVVSDVSAAGCSVKSYKVDRFKFARLGAETALLTYRAEQDTTCGAAHVPTPVWATSLFVKRQGRWVNALYVHTAIPPTSSGAE